MSGFVSDAKTRLRFQCLVFTVSQILIRNEMFYEVGKMVGEAYDLIEKHMLGLVLALERGVKVPAGAYRATVEIKNRH